MNDTLFDMTPYKSEASMSYRPDWTDATGPDPSWDVPDTEPNIETRTDGPDGNAPSRWRIRREFIITLTSGQTVEVKFVPGIEGELSMHQFDFTGSISPTGFKSHFVLAMEAEQFPHPRDYAQAYVQDLTTQMDKKQRQAKNTKLGYSRSIAEPEARTADHENSTFEPAMAENKTTDSSHVPVEVVEELSPEEEADRQRLELKVERGMQQIEKTFYEIGVALRHLRDDKLYRSTHKNFEEYCKSRFRQISDRQARYLILASVVVDDLKNWNNCSDFPLPTKASQVRSMKDLTQNQRREAWQTGVSESGGKVPTARTIKNIVERLKERDTTPPPIPYHQGDVVLIRGLGNPDLRKYDGHWAIAIAINEYTVTIALNGKDIPVKPEFLEPVEPEYWADIKAMNQRITRLQQYELDSMESAGLEVLRRRTCFTPKQITLLKRMENDYGVV